MKLNLFLLILLGQCCVMFCHLYEYHYVNEEKNWTEAQQYCREKHTDLATVSDMEGLKRLLNKSPGRAEAWIGLYDQTNGTRRWYWSLPGVEFNEDETEWNSTEPDDHNTENCGCILKSLKWMDISCGRHQHFLCCDERNTSEKFYLIKQKKTWFEAQSYCRENHTDLPSGLDQLQGERLKNVLSSTGGKYVYMGLMRDTWRWSDGSSFSFRHWNKDFDDERYNSGQCAMTVFGDEGRWKTENCTDRKPFICYDEKLILIKENKTWKEALYYCRHHHHDLVTITNLDEQRWVQEKAKKASTDYVWMGLRYACSLDFWFWVRGEVVSYKNWAPDELMDDCDMSGAMKTGGQHKWLKMNDQMEFNFVCSVS
ncbi:C-type mannose receptor 2-like [Fundulus heteroclitus]|uniref:C-type mannose receptor 2-like n=1 Tax=Fundulus heteroclitus TaxID=8078 RepID=UPI00165C1509|nr:C-type mannose receptor 2-like [Fundulus heteroclitus]